MKPEGQAQAGDVLKTPWGQWLEVVSVVGAGDVIEAVVERSITAWRTTPNYNRDSAAAMCVMFSGQTTGREKRRMDRARERMRKPVRVVVTDRT